MAFFSRQFPEKKAVVPPAQGDMLIRLAKIETAPSIEEAYDLLARLEEPLSSLSSPQRLALFPALGKALSRCFNIEEADYDDSEGACASNAISVAATRLLHNETLNKLERSGWTKEAVDEVAPLYEASLALHQKGFSTLLWANKLAAAVLDRLPDYIPTEPKLAWAFAKERKERRKKANPTAPQKSLGPMP